MKSSDIIQPDAITGRVKYCRTEAGQKFLETYDKMILLLDPGFSPMLPNVTTSTRCNTMVGWGKVLSNQPADECGKVIAEQKEPVLLA
jgi:hypothetical protein